MNTETGKPIVVGILDIIAGVVWIGGAAYLGFLVLIIFGVLGASSADLAQPRSWVIPLIMMTPGLVAITGGLAALKRRLWPLTLIGSIFMIPLGLGILTVVLTLRSRKEFV